MQPRPAISDQMTAFLLFNRSAESMGWEPRVSCLYLLLFLVHFNNPHRRQLHGARGARPPPPNLRALGPIMRLSPPIFCHTKFNFYVLFQQVNATATRFTQCHMIFRKFIELNKFSRSIFNYVGYTISSTFKYFNFDFILHTNCPPNNFIF